MKRTLWITLAAILAFAAILIARMPASWLLPSGPQAPFSCVSIEGSLWSGACEGLILQHLPLGDVTWELAPMRLFLGRLAAHVTLNRDAARASADVEAGLSGKLTVRGVLADLPLDPKLLPLLPSTLAGSAHLDLALVRLEHGIVKELRGKIEAHNIEDRQGADTPLGSYVVTFAGGEGIPTGQIRDLDGPLAMEGTLKLTPQPGFELEGLVAPRKGAPPEIINNIRFFGSPDASGRRPFSLSGTF